MTFGKRLMDLGLVLCLSVFLILPIVIIAVIILLRDGRPVFYKSQRMKTPEQSFTLWKFRTMTPEASDASVSAAYKDDKITPLGRALRHRRLDELPQLWNIFVGDMSFVGPRPPLPRFVELCPDLYARVLQNRPGVTGLATLMYHRKEEAILSRCHTADQTDETYLRRCVPIKARIDLIWARHRSVCYDFVLVFQTAARVFGPRDHK
ncbi:MAG: sugar transferase [Pseudomonadota bacterium]